MPFAFPGSSGMRSAGANLTSQVGDISMRTASNLGDIQMAIARMRAAGIQEGSQVWQNVMKQFAAMATAIPQEQRRQRMEQLAIEDQAMQRAREARREQRQEQLLPLETEQRTQAIKIQGLNLKQAERASEVQKLYDDLVIKHTTIDQKTGQLKQNVEAIQDGLIQARYADEAFKVQQQATITRKNNELLDRQARNEKRKLFESTTPSGLALLKAVEDKEPKESQQAAYEAYRGDLLRIKDSMDDPEQSAGYENFINQIFPVEWTPDLYPTAKGFVAKHLTETAAMNMYKGKGEPVKIAGRDIPLPSDVVEQRKDIAAAAKAAPGPPEKPMTRAEARSLYGQILSEATTRFKSSENQILNS